MSSIARLFAGISIIMITFFAGFFLMMQALESGNFSVAVILFDVLGIPLIGLLIGMPIMISSCIRPGFKASVPVVQDKITGEASYVYEPPAVCTSCGGRISSTNVEWVGPLTVKCPYCGISLQAVKRRL
jgi:predicted RNA-binding Zn-ribbon protein involved in translation (DUF1610 family)